MPKQDIKLSEIPIEQLIRGEFQPRQHFDEQQLQELAEAIKTTQGLLQPIVVRPKGNQQFEIIAGERRWKAAQMAGLDTVTCLIRNYTDEQALEAAIIENVSRANLNPIEEAMGYQRLMTEFGYLHEEIAVAVGKSRTKITNSLRILKLDQFILNCLMEGTLSEGHGKILAGLTKNQQIKMAQNCLKFAWSVRKLENEIKKLSSKTPNPITQKNPNIRALEIALADYIGCPVFVNFANNKGKLEIHFHDLDILEGLFAKMNFKLDDTH